MNSFVLLLVLSTNTLSAIPDPMPQNMVKYAMVYKDNQDLYSSLHRKPIIEELAYVLTFDSEKLISKQPLKVFMRKMNAERLAKTKPAEPKFFDCEGIWSCTGNEEQSICKCVIIAMCAKKPCIEKPLVVTIDKSEECSDLVCRIPKKTKGKK